ncbi:hypothetical protein B0H12DRAFT_1076400 [Mycena haematopus]|nr:hypothetical protein B0H12DRAFT_1076400 [Mycena haematopus]
MSSKAAASAEAAEAAESGATRDRGIAEFTRTGKQRARKKVKNIKTKSETKSEQDVQRMARKHKTSRHITRISEENPEDSTSRKSEYGKRPGSGRILEGNRTGKVRTRDGECTGKHGPGMDEINENKARKCTTPRWLENGAVRMDEAAEAAAEDPRIGSGPAEWWNWRGSGAGRKVDMMGMSTAENGPEAQVRRENNRK